MTVDKIMSGGQSYNTQSTVVTKQANTVGQSQADGSVAVEIPMHKSEYQDPTDNASKEDPDEKIIDNSVEQANKTLKLYNREIVREVHEVTKAVMYTIKDTETHEVIAEFPPKKIEDMIAKMWELAGLFVDEKA